MKEEFYSDSQVLELVNLRRSGLQWVEVADKFNKKFSMNKSSEALRLTFNRYKDSFDLSDEKVQIKQLQSIIKTKQSAAKNAKENKAILEYLTVQDDLLERIAELVKTISKQKFKVRKNKVSKGRKPMTLELMLSDLHYGKKTDTFNLSVARRRMSELKDTLLDEIERNNKVYNVERIILALLGDIIESSTMHGVESAKGCEFSNSRQVVEAINSLFHDMILPVAMTGIEIDVPCVTGNHDRTEKDRTMHNPGEENLTFIIYSSLEMLCKQSGLSNVKFHIPKVPYQLMEIYNNNVLYEHFDNANSNTKNALEKLMNDRQKQVQKIVHFFRGGHFHETTIYERGRIIVNGSLPGPDSYSNVKGFDSHSDQMLNYYIPTDKRPTCYFRSFPIYLA